MIGGFVDWISDHEVVGRAYCQGGWGHRFPYSVYFYAQFSVPTLQRLVANGSGFVEGPVATTTQCQAVASFGQQQMIEVRVGISYVSVAKARACVVRETQGKTFDAIRNEVRATWERALGRISVEGGTHEQTLLFYTLFARLLCMPSDLGIDDEFSSWHSGVRHFTDIYCLWDSVRNANSLLSLFDPQMEVALLNSLLDIADHVAWLPDAWIAGHAAQIQGGSSADILFCEAALKGLTGIDYEKALGYMCKNNEIESPDPWRLPYLYHYVGRPDKSSSRVHALRKRFFHATRNGLIDNEDMGCQSAWFMCSTPGLYPIMGQDLYMLIAPAFTRAEVALGSSGKYLVIEAPEAGEEYIYVKAVTLNGKPLHRAWLRHHEITQGAVLRFTLDRAPGGWGTRELPPSPMQATE